MPNQIKPIKVSRLLLDTDNYRINKQSSQKETIDAIIAEQGQKLIVLAEDIINLAGLSPFDLPCVVPSGNGDGRFIVVEGNRRLTALKLLREPELAVGTTLHTKFKNLHKKHPSSIPTEITCSIVSDIKTAHEWIKRKHASGQKGAGTEPWTSMAKERAKRKEGLPSPLLDILDYVRTNDELDLNAKETIESSKFNLTTFERLIGDPAVRQTIGLNLSSERATTDYNPTRVMGILTEFVTYIATQQEYKEKKFTERAIDSDNDRREFTDFVVSHHPRKTKSGQELIISGAPQAISKPKTGQKKAAAPKSTVTTKERKTLVSTDCKIRMPSGKVNDIFKEELKKLNVYNFRFSVAVLFRVFIELSVDSYIEKHRLQLKKDNKGNEKNSLKEKLEIFHDHAKDAELMTYKDLKTVREMTSKEHSVCSTDTFNAFVHSQWFEPDPERLKIAWNITRPFIEKMWESIMAIKK